MKYHGDGILASDLIALLLDAIIAAGSNPFVVVGNVDQVLLADVVEVDLDVVEGLPTVVLLVRAAELVRGA